jgi:hypothetical protein
MQISGAAAGYFFYQAGVSGASLPFDKGFSNRPCLKMKAAARIL